MKNLRAPLALSTIALLASPHVLTAQDDPRRPDERTQRPDGNRGQGRNGMGPGSGRDMFDGRPEMNVGNTIADWENLEVHDAAGKAVRISSLVPEDGCLVVVNGCLTCPKFLQSYAGIEAVARDHAGNEKVRFVYLYKTLAHPENNGFVQPFTLEERLSHVAEATRRLKNSIPFVCDGMENKALAAFGRSPNSQVVVDGQGKILHSRGWADGKVLRPAMVKIAGETEEETDVSELDLPPFTRVTRSSGRVVPRAKPQTSLVPIRVEPAESKELHYVKLRAELGTERSESGHSELYLGFHLDPIHDVHWNNLVDPLAYTITVPEGVEVTPLTASAPKIEVAMDSDPREFLTRIKGWKVQGPIEVKVTYFACSDGNGNEEEAFCRKVEQVYLVHQERDRMAGTVQARMGRRGGGQGRNRGQGDLMSRMDADNDGSLSRSEVKGTPMEARFDRMDRNGDGVLSKDELDRMMRRPGRRGGNDRQRRPDRSGEL